jgi:hypothetical protein
MAGNSDQWAALDSQNERLIDMSMPLPVIEDPASKRKLRHRRMTRAAAGRGEVSRRARPGRRRGSQSQG